MEHKKKIEWMIMWAHKNKCRIELEGECGFGRECVGIIASNGCYPDYCWYNEEYDRIDKNGDVWCPIDSYHKHECVAVLGRGKKAESQLYDWLKWFDKNGFKLEMSKRKIKDPIDMAFHGHENARMVKKRKRSSK